jgi:hypothetical protein
MKRSLFFICLLSVSALCFPQQLPSKIIGQIPTGNSTKNYQIQVGAFGVYQNAENASARLKREGFSPIYEKYNNLTRVIVAKIPANQVRNYLIRIKRIGFDEVIIREEARRDGISEKWEITAPGSPYSSFEFNSDYNFIVVENSDSDESEELVRFGKYNMPSKDVIELIDFGILKIGPDNNQTDLSFTPINEPEKEIRLSASKAEKMPQNADTDLFCRTWKVVNCTDTDNIGLLFFISNAGTYFVTTPDGEANSMSQWRWYNNKTEEFEYTHDDWEYYGRAKILELKRNYLKILDPGFLTTVPGYSNAGYKDYWELVPVN